MDVPGVYRGVFLPIVHTKKVDPEEISGCALSLIHISITVPGYDGENQDQVVFDQAGLDLTTSPEEEPLIQESDFGPGSTGIRMIQVSNGENLSAKIKFRFTVESDDLADALWFDFIPIEKADSTEGGPVKTRELIKRPMAQLTDCLLYTSRCV